MFQRHSYHHQQHQQLHINQTDFNFSSDQSRDLDLEYLHLRQQISISQYYLKISKHIKIRLTGWLHKLDQIISNPIWKRNRNNYVKLIKLICQCQTVVKPFDSLPPQGDVPKLNKHQINHIIDSIQRIVKIEKNHRKNSTEVLCQKMVNIKPQDYWSRIKNAREIKSQEQSVFLGKFAQVGQKYQQKINRNTYYSMVEDHLQGQDHIYHSQVKGKQNVISNKLSNSTNKSSRISQRCNKQPKRLMIKLNLQPKQTQKPLPQSISQSINEQSFQFYNKQHYQINAFRDNHISISVQNNTLKTQMFEQDLTINHQVQSEMSIDQYNLDDQLSERCRNRNQIPNHTYFQWKLPQQQEKYGFYKNRGKFVEITPCKIPYVQIQDYSPHLVTVCKSQQQFHDNLMKESGITNKLQQFSIEQSQQNSQSKQKGQQFTHQQ